MRQFFFLRERELTHAFLAVRQFTVFGSVCRSCVTVTARPASTQTALVSQSLVGLCFAFNGSKEFHSHS